MRKWMRERIQRRKKNTAEKESPAAPPLQPAYFDAEPGPQGTGPAAEAEETRQAESEPAMAEDSSPESSSEESRPAAANRPSNQRAAGSSGGGAARRGRRRRGGRGRGGRGREQAVAQAFAPAAGKGIIPEPATEAAEEPSGEAAAEVEAEPETEAAAPVGGAAKVQAAKVPAAVPAAPVRSPKGIVVLAIGLPGSGKSSWFKRHNVVPLSSDMVRSLLFDDVREQRFQDLVFSNLRSMLKARLIAKRPMNYVDATNLTPQERQHWIKLAKDYNYEVHAVFFDVPLEVCIERHQRRDRVVPEDMMRKMAAKLKPPSFDEGIAKITVVRVKKKEE
jgi:predicted kinase